MSDKLLSIQETAKFLGVHFQTVRNHIKNGSLPASKIGRNIRIKMSDIEHFVEEQTPKERIDEIEIRFFTKRREIIEKKLLSLNAKVVYHGHIIDHWFVPNNIKNNKEKDEWFETGIGYGLRIREQDNGYTGRITSSLEVKRLVTPYHHEHCLENEIEVSNYEEVASLLKSMNMKEFICIDKDRLVYKLDDYKIAIDDIKDFGVGIEIEVMTSKSKAEIWTELESIAKRIGLDLEKELVEKSVTYLYIQKMARY